MQGPRRAELLQETTMSVETASDPSRRPPDRALHEGHAAVPDVRLFQPHGAGAQGRGAQLHTVNVLEDPEIRANLPRYSDWPTFPQLFINGELIGGCDITVELPSPASWPASSPTRTRLLVLEDDSRVQHAFWGGYGVAKAGLGALLKILAEELDGGAVKLTGMRPGPMRTNLRSRVFFAEDPGQWPAPAHYAAQCVAMLSGQDATPHGQVWVAGA
jgi:NAD(P)-dependent dehydrogenase (short-subunit alcohol dehydrogenase family)